MTPPPDVQALETPAPEKSSGWKNYLIVLLLGALGGGGGVSALIPERADASEEIRALTVQLQALGAQVQTLAAQVQRIDNRLQLEDLVRGRATTRNP